MRPAKSPPIFTWARVLPQAIGASGSAGKKQAPRGTTISPTSRSVEKLRCCAMDVAMHLSAISTPISLACRRVVGIRIGSIDRRETDRGAVTDGHGPPFANSVPIHWLGRGQGCGVARVAMPTFAGNRHSRSYRGRFHGSCDAPTPARTERVRPDSLRHPGGRRAPQDIEVRAMADDVATL